MQTLDVLNSVPMIVDWPTTWSKVELYATCHWKFYLQEGSKFVTGKKDIPFATNRAMELGELKHGLYESAALIWRDKGTLPTSISDNPLWNPTVGKVVRNLIASYLYHSVEEKIGIDSTWKTWSLGEYWNPDKTLFASRKMMIRSKMDLAVFDCRIHPENAVIVDYKSGKVRISEGLGQLALYALTIFCKYPYVNSVECVYLFVDHNYPHQQTYTRSQVPELKLFFADKILEIQRYLKTAQTRTPYNDATPGNCHWCAATREQCEHKG